MHLRVLLLLPLFLSCSIFDNEQSFEINPQLIYGEWHQFDFEGKIEFLKVEEFDTTSFTNGFHYVFQENNTCKLTDIVPKYWQLYNCEWKIYGELPEIFLKIDYDLQYGQWPLFNGDLYRITELSEEHFQLYKVGTKRKSQ